MSTMIRSLTLGRLAFGARILCGLVITACWSPIATQLPAGEAPPESIFGLYAPAGKTGIGSDAIRVTPRPNGKAGLTLKLYYANGHTCELEHEGEWLGDHLLVTAEGLRENEFCKLEAYFPKGRILLKDQGQRCAQVYCGTRGKLDGVTLPKRRSLQK
jgi:hypothetical protein